MPFMIGFFDRDVSVWTALRFPALYMSGRLGMDLNVAHMAFDTILAIVCSLIVYYFVKLDYSHLDVFDSRAASAQDVWTFGTTVFAGMVLGMSALSCMLVDTWLREWHLTLVAVIFQLAMCVRAGGGGRVGLNANARATRALA